MLRQFVTSGHFSEIERHLRAVMRVALARRLHGLPGLARGFLDGDFAEHRLEHLGRDCSRAEHCWHIPGERDDGAFDPYGARPAIDDSCDAVRKLCGHVLCGRWAHVLEQVCARGCKRESRFLDNRLRYGVAREPYCDGRETARAQVGDAVLLREDDGHRAWPEGFRQPVCGIGNVAGDVLQFRDVCDVHDERVERRPFLRGKNFRERFGVVRVPRKPIDGLCRDGDHFAFLEEPCGF